ncbi:iron-regulated protein [Robertkochia marina]|uniref:Iron-regulated protein n=1 Tax=Robertkochia marina TaxID=1227945 RepID=A0A4S3M3F6_9FLAO|nr:ChaN family lipoprotein [Robertkochia marina]THD69275.1 iron-regulated protein [Robertkochia marina]TRZ47466.1 iron-regulated protein [Robertkochia marina]
MKNIFLLIAFILTLGQATAQKEPYRIYNQKGKKVSYKKMLRNMEKSELVFLGELHNDPIAHWLQLEITKDLHSKEKLVMGAEMFEADNQDAVNQYLSKEIDKKALDTLARLWPNYPTDYAPLLNFARDKGIRFVATNIPRRYANDVYKGGFEVLDSLSEKEKNWMAPLPIAFDPELPTYQKILEMMGGHGSETLVMAQAMKDATMAHFILKNMKKRSIFIHYNGSYHSDFKEGIVWYIKRQKPELEIVTFTTVLQEDISKLEKEHAGKADYILVVDEDMTRTY